MLARSNHYPPWYFLMLYIFLAETHDSERNEQLDFQRSGSPSTDNNLVNDIYNFIGHKICIEKSNGDITTPAVSSLLNYKSSYVKADWHSGTEAEIFHVALSCPGSGFMQIPRNTSRSRADFST